MIEFIEFEVNKHTYQARILDVFDQMLIAKRLMPVLKNIVTPEVMAAAMAGQPSTSDTATKDQVKLDAARLLPAIADAIYALTDDDAKSVVRMCLSVVTRKNEKTGGLYSPMTNAAGWMMFNDVTMLEMLQVSYKVIEGSLGSFFGTAP